ncbi:uncharacterized protein BXZ73DRAFT_106159 [Epithele typhae]|uniref:uncharacterized protein n=1 Tax=Epithele typhae TaxID=378194 RepID=UPI002007D1FC|nr:uncharacterized protein BXZ73DRAFT_106159 [Epithele typhae]KAH9915430.1 hypothetical protein BXZ73DRAFT_106159 [Epithele typhae]
MNRLNGLLFRSTTTDTLSTETKSLPVGQLESLRFKTDPIILSKYNILLSQSHGLPMTLSAAHQASAAALGNRYEKTALAPRAPLSDAQVDADYSSQAMGSPSQGHVAPW